MTFIRLLAILNEKCSLDKSASKVLFGDNGGYIDWCGIRFGFTFGSDDAEWYDGTGDAPGWTKILDETFLEQILKKGD